MAGTSYRTLQVTLTEREYEALAGAVALQEAELEGEVNSGYNSAAEARAIRDQLRTLNAGWNKVRRAWYKRPTARPDPTKGTPA